MADREADLTGLMEKNFPAGLRALDSRLRALGSG
jgi:hypothetical protein